MENSTWDPKLSKIIFLFNRAIFRFHMDFSGVYLKTPLFFWAPAAGGGQIGASEMHWLIWSWRKNSLSFWNSSIIGNRLVTSSSEVKNLEPQAVHCKCHSILEMTLSVWKMKILPLRLGTFLTCHLSKATSFSLVLFSLRNLAAMNKKSTTSNCAGSHYFPITQWVPSIRRLCYTVDGSEIRLTNWGTGSWNPIIYKVRETSKRWLWMGFAAPSSVFPHQTCAPPQPRLGKRVSILCVQVGSWRIWVIFVTFAWFFICKLKIGTI